MGADNFVFNSIEKHCARWSTDNTVGTCNGATPTTKSLLEAVSITNTTIVTKCSACSTTASTPFHKVLGAKYCLIGSQACKHYYDSAQCTADRTTGNCNRIIEHQFTCMIAVTNATNTLGDSGTFVGCPPGFYLRAYVCMACTGATDYVDYMGINC